MPESDFQIGNLFQDFVKEKYGISFWKELLDHVTRNYYGRDEFEFFQKTLSILVHKTKCSKEFVLEEFGHYYFQNLSATDTIIIRNVAGDWLDFLRNLDYLQWITANRMLVPMTCTFSIQTGRTRDQLFLDCYSTNLGLYPMVKGILSSALGDLYPQKVFFDVVSVQCERVINGSVYQEQEHSLFKIGIEPTNKNVNGTDKNDDRSGTNISNVPPTFIYQTRKYAERQIHLEDIISHGASKPPRLQSPQNEKDRRDKKAEQITRNYLNSLPVSPSTFARILPYHVIFNSSMEILQVGVYLQRFLPEKKHGRPKLQDFLDFVYPKITGESTHDNICSFINSPFLLKLKRTDFLKAEHEFKTSLLLRGEMILLEEKELILYLCSPFVNSFQDLESCQMKLCHIPLYDPTRDKLFFNKFQSFGQSRNFVSKYSRKNFLPEVNEEKSSRERSLGMGFNLGFNPILLPKEMSSSTANEQLPKQGVNDNVSLLFCDIVNFSSLTKTCSPAAIIEMINQLYDRFHSVTNLYDTFRVETIGDAFLVLSGAPQAVPDHALRIAKTSLALQSESKQVISPDDNRKFISVRIGVHTGSVKWGILGKHLPRFIVMGETVMIASRMESHGLPDQIHITEQVYNSLVDFPMFSFKERGLVEIKGIGVIKTYFLIKTTNFTD